MHVCTRKQFGYVECSTPLAFELHSNFYERSFFYAVRAFPGHVPAILFGKCFMFQWNGSRQNRIESRSGGKLPILICCGVTGDHLDIWLQER